MDETELEGMPEVEPRVISKATGVLKTERGVTLPEVGDRQKFNRTYVVDSITERKDKEGDPEFVVAYKAVMG